MRARKIPATNVRAEATASIFEAATEYMNQEYRITSAPVAISP